MGITSVVYKLTGAKEKLSGTIVVGPDGLLLLDYEGNQVDVKDIDYCIADIMSEIAGYEFYVRC